MVRFNSTSWSAGFAPALVMAARSLRAYALGLLAFMLIKVLAPGFFAREDTRTPVRIGIIAMIANMVFNLILIWPLDHVGLALATSLSAFLNAGLLWWYLRRDGVWHFQPGWGRYLLQLALAMIVLAVITLYLRGAPEDWLSMSGWERVKLMLALVVFGATGYFATLALTGVRVRHFKLH